MWTHSVHTETWVSASKPAGLVWQKIFWVQNKHVRTQLWCCWGEAWWDKSKNPSPYSAVLFLTQQDDNSSYRNVCKISVVSFALAVIFIIRLFSTSVFRVPKLIGGHFGSEAKVLLRKVELAQRKAVRHQAAVDFLTKCVTYNLSPRFLQFKLHRSNLQEVRCVHSFHFRFSCTKHNSVTDQMLPRAGKLH